MCITYPYLRLVTVVVVVADGKVARWFPIRAERAVATEGDRRGSGRVDRWAELFTAE